MFRWFNPVFAAILSLHHPGVAQEKSHLQQEVEEVAQAGIRITQTKGKEALVLRYREIISRNSDAQDNLQIEGMIANVYVWDLSERNEPTDMAKAFDVCTKAIAQHENTNPHMKEIRISGRICG